MICANIAPPINSQLQAKHLFYNRLQSSYPRDNVSTDVWNQKLLSKKKKTLGFLFDFEHFFGECCYALFVRFSIQCGKRRIDQTVNVDDIFKLRNIKIMNFALSLSSIAHF